MKLTQPQYDTVLGLIIEFVMFSDMVKRLRHIITIQHRIKAFCNSIIVDL